MQVERARDLEDEVRKRLRPLALQATAAERAEKLGGEIGAPARARSRRSTSRRLGARRGERRGRARPRLAPPAPRSRRSSRPLLAERARAEEELDRRRRHARAGDCRALPGASGAERIELRRESAAALAARLRADLDALPTTTDAPARQSAAQLARAADTAERERDDLAARAQLARERLAVLEQSLAEREGLPPAARALAEEGERLLLSLLDVAEGDERAVAAALRQRASAVVVDDAARALELVERAWAGGLGPLTVLVGCEPHALLRELPVVPREELLASSVPAVTKEGIGWDPGRGELWFAGETAEAVLLELEARRGSSPRRPTTSHVARPTPSSTPTARGRPPRSRRHPPPRGSTGAR